MYALLAYSLKTGVCLAVFYLFYKLLLSRETFHRLNRIVVLGAFVLSFVLPLCVITVYRELPLPDVSVADTVAAVAPEPAAEPFAWDRLLGALFVAGAAATLARTLLSLVQIRRLVRGGRRETLENGSVLVVTGREVTPFSWGRYIVLSQRDADGGGREILLHEQAHRRLHHSRDLLFTDVAGCLQWFNPAMWLLRRELRAIHEYEADEAVLASGVDARQYQLLLVRKAAGTRGFSIANNFNHNKLKNRITMMLRTRSSRWATARTLLLLPLTALALGAFAETAYVVPAQHPNTGIRIDGDNAEVSRPGPVYIVDGREVTDLKGVDRQKVVSMTVRKDSSAVRRFGERGKYGVVTIMTNKAGDTTVMAPVDYGAAADGTYGNATHRITIRSGKAGGSVVTYGQDTGADTLRGRIVSLSGPKSEKRIVVIDGLVATEQRMNAIPADEIVSVEVAENPGSGPNVVHVRTRGFEKRIEAQRKAAEEVVIGGRRVKVGTPEFEAAVRQQSEVAVQGIEAGAAGIESARKALDAARSKMGEQAWREARKSLDEAARQLDEARRSTAQRLDEVRQVAAQQADVSVHIDTMRRTEGLGDDVVIAFRSGSETAKHTLGKGERPLVVLDGKIVPYDTMNGLDPAQIESISVLKDRTSVKKYGKKGRNGVIIITTKHR